MCNSSSYSLTSELSCNVPPVDAQPAIPALYRRMLLQENASLYVKRHQKLRAAWQPVWGPPPPPPPVPHTSSASLFQEGEGAGEELHLIALWHSEDGDAEADTRVQCRGMTTLLRVPVRFRMSKKAFQCPLNMGLVRRLCFLERRLTPALRDRRSLSLAVVCVDVR